MEGDYVCSYVFYFYYYKKKKGNLGSFPVVLCGFDPTTWIPRQSDQYFLSFYGQMD